MANTVEALSSSNREAALAYLRAHEESSQFLLNNLELLGGVLTEHPNSGNFKVIRGTGGAVKGVFCLARRGNLLAQAEGDCSEIILQACAQEPVELKGFIGGWDSVEPILKKFRERNPAYRPAFESKEILYSYSLETAPLVHDARVRFLEPKDYADWAVMSRAYMEELHLPDDMTEDQKRESYDSAIKDRVWWGLFENDRLLSRAALNSKGKTIGQVGGVYTPPRERKQGYAKAVMLHMLKDCREQYGHSKSILFTGETDFPAQKLYESIGYQRIGHFALVLG